MKNSEPEEIPPFSSAETIANNLDLLNELLLRLPAISLLKFKCVSKQWLQFISDPKFCTSHTRRHLNPNSTSPAGLFLDKQFSFLPLDPHKYDDLSTKIHALDYMNNGGEIQIEQSCNGLLLYSYSEERDFESCILYGLYGKVYFICNPTTKQFKRVQFSKENEFFVRAVFLAFDPSKSPHYKLILFYSFTQMRRVNFQLDMYSSETDSWSLLGINVPLVRDCFPRLRGVYCRNAVHWPPTRKFGTCLYFDVETESLKEMQRPPSYLTGAIGGKVYYFGESRGHLHLVISNLSESLSLEFDVLEMEMDYSQWSVRYRVNLGSVKMEFPELAWYVRGVVSFSILSIVLCGDCNKKEEENAIVVICVDDVVLAYNMCNGTSKKLCDCDGGRLDDGTENLEWYSTFRFSMEFLAFAFQKAPPKRLRWQMVILGGFGWAYLGLGNFGLGNFGS
ncbi:F-box protein At5g07610-like [Mercurialis annua]|uniref:F-box protein At5g07610-like n=1 Tax=Mercurialis annua TaxID=3986 RepID=UPI00215F28D7|nr:F-box protein At5g07610-like [Mercurialis annua]